MPLLQGLHTAHVVADVDLVRVQHHALDQHLRQEDGDAGLLQVVGDLQFALLVDAVVDQHLRQLEDGREYLVAVVQVQVVPVAAQHQGTAALGATGVAEGDSEYEGVQEHLAHVLVAVIDYFVRLPQGVYFHLLLVLVALDDVHVLAYLLLVDRVDVPAHHDNSLVAGVIESVAVDFLLHQVGL